MASPGHNELTSIDWWNIQLMSIMCSLHKCWYGCTLTRSGDHSSFRTFGTVCPITFAYGLVAHRFVSVLLCVPNGSMLSIYSYTPVLHHRHSEKSQDYFGAPELILKDMGKISRYQTRTKHNKAHIECIFFMMYSSFETLTLLIFRT